MTNIIQLSPRTDHQPASSEELLLHAVTHIVALTKHVARAAHRRPGRPHRCARGALASATFHDSASLGRRQASGACVRVFETIDLSIFP